MKKPHVLFSPTAFGVGFGYFPDDKQFIIQIAFWSFLWTGVDYEK